MPGNSSQSRFDTTSDSRSHRFAAHLLKLTDPQPWKKEFSYGASEVTWLIKRWNLFQLTVGNCTSLFMIRTETTIFLIFVVNPAPIDFI